MDMDNMARDPIKDATMTSARKTAILDLDSSVLFRKLFLPTVNGYQF